MGIVNTFARGTHLGSVIAKVSDRGSWGKNLGGVEFYPLWFNGIQGINFGQKSG